MADDWRHLTWGELAILEYGKGLRGYKDAVGQYRVFGTNGPIGWHTEALCEFPTVIVGRKGAYRGIHYSKKPCFVIDTAFYLKPKLDFNMRWAYYELLTHDINSMDSGSAIPSTSRESFYCLPVRYPPLEEQETIANILGTLDNQIELNRRMNQTLEQMAMAIFKSWFVDFDPVHAKAEGRKPAGMSEEIAKLFSDSFEDSEFGPIPKGWKVGVVGDCFDLTMGQSPPGDTYNEIGDGVLFFQGRRDFGFRYPSPRVFCTAPTRFAAVNDTLVSVRAPVGDVNMASQKCCVGRGVAAIRHKSRSRSYTYYMMHHLGDFFKRFEAEGTVFGSINKKDFESMECIIPPSAVISSFEKLAYPIDQQIEVNEKQSQSLASIRDALLPKLLSGEIQVKDVDRLVE